MTKATENQWTILNSIQDDYLDAWIEAFLFDRKAQNMSKGTLSFYVCKLGLFSGYCDSQQVKRITQITPNLIRQYLLYLEQTGHNPGGIHACFRTVKTFLLWWEREVEPDGWKNPIRKVKAPKMGIEPLDPVNIEDVSAILDTCSHSTLLGLRDKAIFFVLLDSGIRASELLALNLEDLKLSTGEILIRQGKGRKPRSVYIGSKSRKSIRSYLRKRLDKSPALFITNQYDRLTYWGLKSIVNSRSRLAKIKPPSIHSFRRWFALNCLRSGINIYTLQVLMGHSDLQVLRRYLKQTNEDILLDYQALHLVDNYPLH